jgi:hypothetical protein
MEWEVEVELHLTFKARQNLIDLRSKENRIAAYKVAQFRICSVEERFLVQVNCQGWQSTFGSGR